MLKEIDDSKMNMWRAIVALVHADGLQHPEEDAFIQEKIAVLPFTEEQKQVLNEEMKNPSDVNDLFQQITHSGDRSQFIYFARLLFWSDGDFDAQEEHILKFLREQTLSKVDLEKVMHSVDQIAEDFAQQHRDRGFRQKLADFVGRFFE
jgi:uncharacterized membrane protein YebE (DUF533 family)